MHGSSFSPRFPWLGLMCGEAQAAEGALGTSDARFPPIPRSMRMCGAAVSGDWNWDIFLIKTKKQIVS